jgi:hypothetical protein
MLQVSGGQGRRESRHELARQSALILGEKPIRRPRREVCLEDDTTRNTPECGYANCVRRGSCIGDPCLLMES